MLKKLKEIEFPLLGKKRITFEVEHQGASTPKKETIKAEVAEATKVNPELISVKHIYSKFGSQKSKVIAHIYKDEKTLKFLETPKGKKEKRVKKKK